MNREKQIEAMEDAFIDAIAVKKFLANRPNAITRFEDDCRAIEAIKTKLKQTRPDLLADYRASDDYKKALAEIEEKTTSETA